MHKINGFNHIMLLVRDMDAAIHFYVGILGFRVKATTESTMSPTALSEEGSRHTSKLYFLEVTNGTMLVLGEVKDGLAAASAPAIDYYWPEPRNAFTGSSHLDHLAFNVDTLEELVWFKSRLEEHGIEVSEVLMRGGRPKFVKSIYFYDQDHTPLEIATWDYSSSEWDDHRNDNYYLDENPPPSVPEYARGVIGGSSNALASG